MKKIAKKNKIFLSKEFEKDKYMYYGLFENETNKDIEIYIVMKKTTSYVLIMIIMNYGYGQKKQMKKMH